MNPKDFDPDNSGNLFFSKDGSHWTPLSNNDFSGTIEFTAHVVDLSEEAQAAFWAVINGPLEIVPRDDI